MEEKRTTCEALISGKWYLIPVKAITEYDSSSSKVLTRCPECKSKIKLMKESHTGNRSHFEHDSRNANCSESVAFGKYEEYGDNLHIYIEATTEDIELSKSHESLLDYIIRVSTNEPKAIDDDIDDLFTDSTINATETKRLISSRLGQGEFRKALISYWKGCSVTKAKDISMLLASHIKPWSMCNNFERLDKFNGFLLSPNIDRAFDQGFISFDDNGLIKISTELKEPQVFGIEPDLVIQIEDRHKNYLAFHREYVFKNT